MIEYKITEFEAMKLMNLGDDQKQKILSAIMTGMSFYVFGESPVIAYDDIVEHARDNPEEFPDGVDEYLEANDYSSIDSCDSSYLTHLIDWVTT